MKRILINNITGNVLSFYSSDTLSDELIIKETAENNQLQPSEVEIIQYAGTEPISGVRHKYNHGTQQFETRSDWVAPPVLTQEELDAIRVAQQAQQAAPPNT